MEPSPALAAGGPVMMQSLEDGLVKWATELALRGVRVRVDDELHRGVRLLEVIEQVDKLGINDDGVDFCKVKDVGDVIGLEAIVDGNVDAAGGSNAEDGFQEGWRVGGEDANALVVVFDQVVSQPPGAVGELLATPAASVLLCQG